MCQSISCCRVKCNSSMLQNTWWGLLQEEACVVSSLSRAELHGMTATLKSHHARAPPPWMYSGLYPQMDKAWICRTVADESKGLSKKSRAFCHMRTIQHVVLSITAGPIRAESYNLCDSIQENGFASQTRCAARCQRCFLTALLSTMSSRVSAKILALTHERLSLQYDSLLLLLSVGWIYETVGKL